MIGWMRRIPPMPDWLLVSAVTAWTVLALTASYFRWWLVAAAYAALAAYNVLVLWSRRRLRRQR